MYTYETPKYQKKSQWEKAGSAVVKALVKSCEYFCQKTSMHGFNQIAAPGRHWVERLLWILACAFAIWGTVDVSLDQLQRYQESPTVVTLEKNFRSWRYSLPAVTACNEDKIDRNKLPEVIKSRWNSVPGDEKYEYYTRFVNAVANSNIFNLNLYEEFEEDSSLNVDLFKLAVEVASEVQLKTTISEKVVLKWTPVMTEAGVCYTTNSLAIYDVAIVKPAANDTSTYPVTCKYSSQSCSVMFELNSPMFFYTHSPYGIVDISDPPSRIYPTLIRTTEMSVMETRCGRGVKELSPKRRACLYTDEPSDAGKKVYSMNTCRLACRRRLAQDLCGCVPFYYFYDDGVPCSLVGMKCLMQQTGRLLHGAGHCSCSPQCVNCVYKELAHEDQLWMRGPLAGRGSIKYIVQAPRTRYTREIVFHFQDLVVSFGGATGLFLGASFISFVEIIYFIMVKVLSYFFQRNTRDNLGKIKQKRLFNVPFEAIKIMELNHILEEERKYFEDNK